MHYESYFIHGRYVAALLHSRAKLGKATRRPRPQGCGCDYFECYIITRKRRLRLAYVRAGARESAATKASAAVTLRKRSVG